MAILAFLAFVLAFIFHGAGFGNLGPWLDWQGLTVLGFVLLSWDIAWPHVGTLYARRGTVVTPPQP